MAGGKEIRNKIKSIKSTQKITRAMQMVAASKMRKAQDQMLASRPYAQQMKSMMAHIARSTSDYQHCYMEDRQVTRVGIIVISSDRGLCGGLNNNLFKQITLSVKKWQSESIGVDFVTIGNKAISFFDRFGGNVLASASHLGDRPSLESLLGVMKVMLDRYESGEISHIYIASNTFINTMNLKVGIEQLLPLSSTISENNEVSEDSIRREYVYEPSAAMLMDIVLKRYIETLIYQAVTENIACEMAARMVAMKAATDNAGELINELQLIYNKARQASITQELSEIVSGAAAV